MNEPRLRALPPERWRARAREGVERQTRKRRLVMLLFALLFALPLQLADREFWPLVLVYLVPVVLVGLVLWKLLSRPFTGEVLLARVTRRRVSTESSRSYSSSDGRWRDFKRSVRRLELEVAERMEFSPAGPGPSREAGPLWLECSREIYDQVPEGRELVLHAWEDVVYAWQDL